MNEYFSKLIDKKFSIDTRTINKGEVFVALKGENFDGTNFIENAFDSGASYAIADISKREFFIGKFYFKKIIFVSDVKNFLFDFAKHKRKILTGTKFVGIVGSVGKTTTRELIYSCLSTIGEKVYRSQKNFNNDIGVPISIANTDNDAGFSVIELGISHMCEMDVLASVLEPDILVITEISSSHLGNFKSLMDIANEKLKILKYVKNDGIVIADGLCPFYNLVNKRSDFTLCYYKNDTCFFSKNMANVALEKCEYDKNTDQTYVHVILEIDSILKEYCFNILVKDLSVIKNMIICLSFLIALINRKLINTSLNNIFEAFKKFLPVSGRGDTYILTVDGKTFTLIDQSYNASISSMRSSISSVRFFYSGNITVVLGDIGELGDFSEVEHLKLLPIIDKNKVDKVYMCGENMKKIFDLLDDTKKCKWSQHSKGLISEIINNVEDGDVMIVKGSHMMNMSCIVDYLVSNFS